MPARTNKIWRKILNGEEKKYVVLKAASKLAQLVAVQNLNLDL